MFSLVYVGNKLPGKRKSFFFKQLEYRFLVGSIRIENTKLQYRAALSNANARTNKVGSIK